MFTFYIDKAIVIEDVKGDVVARLCSGRYMPVKAGDLLTAGTALLFSELGEVLVDINGVPLWLNQSCAACLEQGSWIHAALPEPVSAVSDIAAIVSSCYGGPKMKLDATVTLSAAIMTPSVIDYDNDQRLAEAGFNTAYRPASTLRDDLTLIIVPPEGGEFDNDIYFVEGDLAPATYPVSDNGSVLVEAGSLPLSPQSVAFDSQKISPLLAQLSSALTSGGRDITFRYDTQNNQIVGESEQGIVLTAAVSAIAANGRDVMVSMTVTQFLPLDHFAGEPNVAPIIINGEQIRLDLPVQITDISGNVTQIPIDFEAVIEDGKLPRLGRDNGTVFTEKDSEITPPQTVTGSIPILLGSDEIGAMTFAEQQPTLDGLQSNDIATTYTVEGNTLSLWRADNDSLIITVEIATDGRYTVTQYQSLNQENTADQTPLALALTTTDRDGDVSNVGELLITINDGNNPVLGIDSGTRITEVDRDMPTPQTAMGQIPIDVGSDEIASIVFEPEQPTLEGLLSNGKPTTFEVEGHSLTLRLADAPNTEVLTVTLSPSGEYSVTQYQALNQPVATNIDALALGVVAIDTDGDKSNVGKLTITIVDGPDPVLGDDNGIDITETLAPQTDHGHIVVDVGSDDIDRANFAVAQASLVGITSNGQATMFTIVDNVLNVFVPASGDSPEKPVLTITLANDGSYTVTQHQPIDQTVATNVNTLSIAVTVTDKDGDNSNVGQLYIAIHDGENPTGVDVKADVTVIEGDLSPITADEGYPVRASTLFTVPAVNDAIVATSLNIADEVKTQLLNELSQLTSSGSALTFRVSDPDPLGVITLTGVNNADDTVVTFTFTPTQAGINAQITIHVEQYHPLEHDTAVYAGGEYVSVTDVGVNVRVPLSLHDSDFDPLVEPVSAIIRLDDGLAPVIEDKTQAWTEAFLGTTASPQYISGQFNIGVNSDEIKQVVLGDITTAFSGLTSNGTALVATLVAGSTNHVTLLLSGTDTPVLSLAVNTDGQYTITQFLPIDQPVTSNTNTIVLPFHVIDFDNDSSNEATLTLVITDGENPTGMNTELSTVEGDLTLPVRAPSLSEYPVNNEKILNITAANDSLVATTLAISANVITALIDELGSLTSSNQPLTVTHQVDSTTGIHTINAVVTTSNDAVFVLTLTPEQQGRNVDIHIAWQQLQPLDHHHDSGGTYVILQGDAVRLDVPVTLQDGDDDVFIQPAVITLDIKDGADPQFAVDVGTTITDPNSDATNPNHMSGKITVELGSDAIQTLTFDNEQTGLTGLLTNSTATWVDVSGNTLTLRRASDNAEVLQVSIDLDGQYTVTQFLPLNQPVASNEDRLLIAVTAQDFDGDTAQGELIITVQDGRDPMLGTDTGTDYTEIMTTQNQQGQIPVEVGSDDIADAHFALTQPTLAGLTSNGDATQYRVEGTTVTLYVPANGTTPEQTVLSVILDIDGSYALEQQRPLDQAVESNLTALALDVTVTDKDDDNSNVGQLVIHITDGLDPTGAGVVAELDIEEGDLTADDGDSGYPVSAMGNVIIPAKNDNLVPSSLMISDDIIPLLEMELRQLTTSRNPVDIAITHTTDGMVTVTMTEVGDTEAVFALVLTPSQQGADVNIAMQLTQHQPLDHDATLIEDGTYVSVEEGNVAIALPVQLHDSDLDALVEPVNLQLVFRDGVTPIINEQVIPWTEAFNGAITEPQMIAGQLTYENHSDEIKTVQFVDPIAAFDGITSDGQALTMTFDPTTPNTFSLQLEGTTTDVLRMTIAPDGQYTIVQSLPIDQPVSANQNVINMQIQLEDVDNDKSNVANLQLVIFDGLNPNGVTATLDAIEGDLMTPTEGPSTALNPITTTNTMTIPATNDNVLADSLLLSSDHRGDLKAALEKVTSQGEAITVDIRQDPANQAITFTATQATDANSTVFVLTLTPTQAGRNVSLNTQLIEYLPLDHLDGVLTSGLVTMTQANLAMSIPLQWNDADNDPLQDPAVLTVNIADGDLPTFGMDTGVTLTEISTGNGNLALNVGSDEIITLALNSTQAGLNGLTSNGYPTQYKVTGNTVTVVRQDDPTLTVLTIVLAQNGDYTVTQSQPLDQPVATNALDITLAVIATDQDFDQSAADGEITITIVDGLDPSGDVSEVGTINVTEGDVSKPSSEPDAYPVSDTTTFTLTAGVDRLDPDTVGFSSVYLSALIDELTAEITTAGGQPLQYQFDANSHTLTATDNNQTYFTIALSAVNTTGSNDADVTVTYTQFLPIDHQASGNNSDYIQVSDTVISIELAVQIQDTDGDALLTPVPVTININDGVQPTIVSAENVTVEESDIRAGGVNHQGSTPEGDDDRAGGALTIDEGSDFVRQFRLDTTAFTTLNPDLTSDDVPVTLFEHNVGTYSAFADDRTIFTVVFNQQGAYGVNLFGAIDHPDPGKDTKDIILPVIAIDDDGDTSDAVNIVVSVVDDIPDGRDITFIVKEGEQNVEGRQLLTLALEGADNADIVTITDLGEEKSLVGTDFTVFPIHQGGTTAAPGQYLGDLAVKPNGEVRFSAATEILQTDAILAYTFDYRVTDGDGDTEVRTITLQIDDEEAKIIIEPNPIVTEEDVGRVVDPDESIIAPPTGAPVSLKIDVGDDERGEFLQQVLITIPTETHGTFYLNGVALAISTDGLSYVIPPANFTTTDNQIYDLAGLTFLPDADFSTVQADLTFTVKAQVGVTVGAALPEVSTTFDITVEGIADIPTWNDAQTQLHYTIDEDSAGVDLTLQATLNDPDGSETLSYIITLEPDDAGQFHGELSGNNVVDLGGNTYQVAAVDVGSVSVAPDAHYSGDIRLNVVAQSKEEAVFVTGKQTADSVERQIIINVVPIADETTLKLTRVVSSEDLLIDLASHVSLTPTADTDGSEIECVRFSNLPTGAQILVHGVAVAENSTGSGHYDVNYADIAHAQLKPTPESNLNFEITVEGVVKDNATLTDSGGGTVNANDEYVTAAQQLEVSLKGVADVPIFDIDIDSNGNGVLDVNEWVYINGDPTVGIETLIDEDSVAVFDFTLESGETPLKQPDDDSERLSLVLSGIPEGVKLEDAQGNEQSLVFAGDDDDGNPIYKVELTSLKDIRIVPPLHSTEDIELDAKVLVTENDGDVETFDRKIFINIQPIIDADDYTLISQDNVLEDNANTIKWRPTAEQGFVDEQEVITQIRFGGIPNDYTLLIDGTPLTIVMGEITLSDSQRDELLAGKPLQLQAPQDSDRDVTFQSYLTVEQTDNDGENKAVKVIEGQLEVDIQAVVEPDGTLAVRNSSDVIQTTLTSTAGGIIDLSTGAESIGRVSFTEEGAPVGADTSDEIIRRVVVKFPPSVAQPGDFVVIGGISDGAGAWTVPESQLDNLKITAPTGFNQTIAITISAEVQDQGDNNEGDVSDLVPFTTNITLDFTPNTSMITDLAGDIVFNPDVVIGTEDNSVTLGDQIGGEIVIGSMNSEQDHDSVTIVIKAADLPSGVTISGTDFDFIDGEYVMIMDVTPAGTVDLSSISLNLAEDFAGDFQFDIRIVNTDTTSGNTQVLVKPVTVRIDPVVDVPPQGDPQLSVSVLRTEQLGADDQPIAETGKSEVIKNGNGYEDGIVILAIAASLKDVSMSADEGIESLKQVALTVDASHGAFIDNSGMPVQTITIAKADLDTIQFHPVKDFSGTVTVSAVATVEDDVTYDLTTPATAQATGTFNATLEFDVIPVDDPVVFTGIANTLSGNEDNAGGISLGDVAFAVADTDGSEEIISAKITNVPDGFVLTGPVSNLGDGEWSVSLPVGMQSGSLAGVSIVPAENYSGTLALGVLVFTKETLLDDIAENPATLNVEILPMGDKIDTDVTTSYTGVENQPITLTLDAMVRDDSDSLVPSSSNASENAPEKIHIVVTNVPDTATFEAPVGGSAEKQPDGSWVILSAGTQLETLLFNPGDANGDFTLNVDIRTSDNGVLADNSLATLKTLSFSVEAVNDAPVNSLPAAITADEDIGVIIAGISVSDIDADSGNMTVTLSVEHGVLSVINPSAITVENNDTAAIVLTGTQAAINTALTAGIRYTSDAHFYGDDTLQMLTNDNGNNGTGGAKTDSTQTSITVSPQPDIPVIALDRPQTASVHTVVGTVLPLLGLMASVVNPTMNELSVVISGLVDGDLVDRNGAVIGTQLAPGRYRVPTAALDDLHVTGLAPGNNSLTVEAESIVGSESLLSATSITLNINVEPDTTTQLDASSSPSGGGELVVDDDQDRTLIGSVDDDIFYSGGGNDTLTGDQGADLFLWQQEDIDGSTDVITDFTLGEDKIDLTDVLEDSAGDGLDLDDLLAGIQADAASGNVELTVTASNSNTQTITLENVQAADLGLASTATSAELVTALFNQAGFTTTT